MAVIELKLDPSKRDLKAFGWMLLGFVALLGGLIAWRFEAWQATKWVWIIGGALWALYTAITPLRRPIYLGWMYAAYPIGWTISHLMLAVVFYLVITPIGLALRLFGNDPMHRRLEPEAATYWVKRKPVNDIKRYYRQF